MLIKHSLGSPRPVVYSGDPALDRDAPNFDEKWKAYERTLDASCLPTRPGHALTLFMVAPLTLAQQQHVEDLRWGEKLFETIAYGVHDIRNLHAENERGEASEWKWTRERGPFGQRLPDSVLELFRDDGLRTEIFLRVRQVCGLAPEVRKSDPA